MGTYSLLGGAHEIDGLEPESQGDMAVLKDSSHLDSKRFSAYIALVKADPGAFAVHLADALPASAMMADRPSGQILASTKAYADSSLWNGGTEIIDFMALSP